MSLAVRPGSEAIPWFGRIPTHRLPSMLSETAAGGSRRASVRLTGARAPYGQACECALAFVCARAPDGGAAQALPRIFLPSPVRTLASFIAGPARSAAQGRQRAGGARRRRDRERTRLGLCNVDVASRRAAAAAYAEPGIFIRGRAPGRRAGTVTCGSES